MPPRDVYSAVARARTQREHDEIIGEPLVDEHIADAPPEATSRVAGAVYRHGRDYTFVAFNLVVWETAGGCQRTNGLENHSPSKYP